MISPALQSPANLKPHPHSLSPYFMQILIVILSLKSFASICTFICNSKFCMFSVSSRSFVILVRSWRFGHCCLVIVLLSRTLSPVRIHAITFASLPVAISLHICNSHGYSHRSGRETCQQDFCQNYQVFQVFIKYKLLSCFLKLQEPGDSSWLAGQPLPNQWLPPQLCWICWSCPHCHQFCSHSGHYWGWR